MPSWHDVISHIETHPLEPNGLLMHDGAEHRGTAETIERAIEALAGWTGGTVTSPKLGELINAERTFVNRLAQRSNTDLIAPLVAVEATRAASDYLGSVVIRGRTGKGMRAGDPIPASPVGVHRLPEWAPHECLAGLGLHVGRDEVSELALEAVGTVLKGTIDDPASAPPGHAVTHDADVEPGELLLAQLRRLDLALAALFARYPPATGDRGIEQYRRQAEQHARMPLIVDSVAWGFTKLRGPEDYPAAGTWHPGLDAEFLRGLDRSRPWAAFAFDGDPRSRDATWIERVGARALVPWGTAFFDALLVDDEVASEPVTSSVRRVTDVVLQGDQFDLLVHEDLLGRATVWTINRGTSRTDAEALASCIDRHRRSRSPDQAFPVVELAEQLRRRYGLLVIQVKETAVRQLIRALALAGNARRVARHR
jgi:hypothetical protein